MAKLKTPNFKPGDKVAYSVQWLKSCQLQHSDLAHDRGIVKRLIPLGERNLVEIEWQGDSPPKVLDANLALVGPNMRFANCD